MIPAAPGYYVVYTESAQRPYRDELVGWDDEGWPIVLGDKSTEAINPWMVRRLDGPESGEYADYVQFTPVDDLLALCRAEDGSLFDFPCLGWGVTTAGHIVPVCIEGGDMINAASAGNYVTAFREVDREAVYAANSVKP